MITPHFSCVQNETWIEVRVYLPIFLLGSDNITIESPVLTVRAYPYLLRLKFPYAVKDDQEAIRAVYDPISYDMTVWVTKAVRGQHFEDLDLPARLLVPRKGEYRERLPYIGRLRFREIAPIDDELVPRTGGLSPSAEEVPEATKSGQQAKQESSTQGSSNMQAKKSYGFLNLCTGYFGGVDHSENEVNELGVDAENCDPSERRRRRLKHEDDEFDAEHYIADFVDMNEYLAILCNWKHPFSTLRSGWSFSKVQDLIASTLVHKEYRISPVQTHHLYLTLLTLLFSYAYAVRTTQGEISQESAWTICTLTPALSALDSAPYASSWNPNPELFDEEELAETFAASYRRSLAFPLYRSYALAEACRADVSCFLAGGKRLVLRCLLEIREIIDRHDVYHVYSKVLIDDFCLWAQKYASNKVFIQLASGVSSLKVSKSILGWDLEKLEVLAGNDTNRGPDKGDKPEDRV